MPPPEFEDPHHELIERGFKWVLAAIVLLFILGVTTWSN